MAQVKKTIYCLLNTHPFYLSMHPQQGTDQFVCHLMKASSFIQFGNAFGYLFGGSLWDCLAAFVCGVILQLFFSFLDEKQVNISKVLLDIIGGLLVTVICVVLNRIGVSEHLDLAITGAIIPMIPGVAFTNGIRDIVDGDYLSGCVRLLDAILVFCSIAIGVGLGLKL